MFAWALDALLGAGCAPIVLVVPRELQDVARSLIDTDAVLVTAGGPTRQDSVGLGLEHVDVERVVVHDAARPFVTSDLVAAVVAALDDADAVIAAVPVDETIKRVAPGDVHGSVLETVDRSQLWRAQTPTAFATQSLKDAHRRAREEGFVGTDESQLIERYGGAVKIVLGTRANLKITFPEDFRVAEAMMEAGR